MIANHCICPNNDCSSISTPTSLECAACTSNCMTCTTVDNCTDCEDGYYVSTLGTCIACTVTGCQICPNDNCVQCSAGKQLTTTTNQDSSTSKSCNSICIAGCIQCVDGISCQKCEKNYYSYTDAHGNVNCGKCSDTLFQCLTCNSNNACVQCVDGYYLNNSSCVQCPVGCVACSSADVCLTCSDNYILNIINTSSQVCVPTCPDNCFQCNNPNNCTVCNSGYYWDSSSCQQCPSLCAECTESDQCTSCLSTSYLETLNSASFPKFCNPCSLNCIDCSKVAISGTTNSTLVCHACADGYSIVENACIPKQSTCGDGYFLKNSECIACMTGCKLCSDSLECIISSSGYYLDNDYLTVQSSFGVFVKSLNTIVNIPSRCPVPGKTCTTNLIMTSCEAGYELDDGKCIKKCSDGCKTCYDTGQCTECNAGYAWFDSKCLICLNNCKICEVRDEAVICTECEGSYELIDGACVSQLNISNTLGSIASFIVGIALVGAIIYVLKQHKWTCNLKKLLKKRKSNVADDEEEEAKEVPNQKEFLEEAMKISVAVEEDQDMGLASNLDLDVTNTYLNKNKERITEVKIAELNRNTSENKNEDFRERTETNPIEIETRMAHDVVLKKGGFMSSSMRINLEVTNKGSKSPVMQNETLGECESPILYKRIRDVRNNPKDPSSNT